MPSTAEAFKISNSKANTYRRCPKSYEFHYVMKMRKKGRNIYLERGDWLHQLMMVHYDGHDWRERHVVLKQGFERLFEEEREELGDLPAETARIMRDYLRYWKDVDATERTIDTEVDQLVELPDGTAFNFIIDQIFERRGVKGVFLRDHKTVGRFMSGDYTLLDTQLARYFWAGRKLGYKVTGVQFNEIITKAPTLPKMTPTGKRLEMRKNMHCTSWAYLGEVKRLGLDPTPYRDFLRFLKSQHGEWFRRTYLPRDTPMVKQTMRELLWTVEEIQRATETGHFPRTVIKGSCEFHCDYTEPCIIQLQGGDIEDVMRMKYEESKRPEKDEVRLQWVGKDAK